MVLLENNDLKVLLPLNVPRSLEPLCSALVCASLPSLSDAFRLLLFADALGMWHTDRRDSAVQVRDGVGQGRGQAQGGQVREQGRAQVSVDFPCILRASC